MFQVGREVWCCLLLCVVGGLCQLQIHHSPGRELLTDAAIALADRYAVGKTVAFFYRKPPSKIILQEILLRLHAKWTVLLPSKGQKFDFLQQYDGGLHSYINCFFVVPIKNDNYEAQLNTILYSQWNMDYTDLEGTHTRFVIVVDGEISRSEALGALKALFRRGDIDAVIIGLENGIVSVFTYFPFGLDGKNCPENNLNLTYLGQYNSSFEYNINFFPNKVPLKFMGCKLPVSTVKYPPLIFSEEADKYDGIDYLMVSFLAKHLNTSLEIIYYDHLQGWIWFDKSTGIPKGSLTDVRTGKAWLTFSGVSNNLMHYRVMVTSIPYVFPKLVWFFANPRPVETWKLVYLAFSTVLWICVIALSLICPIVVTCMARLSKNESILSSTGRSMMVHLSLSLGNSTGYAPKSSILRIIFTTWLFYTLHLNNAYTASLTGLITGGKTEPKIETIDDIIKENLPTYLIEYLVFGIRLLGDKKVDRALSKKITLKNYTSTFHMMSSHRNISVLDNDLYIDYLIKRDKIPIYKTPVVLFSVPMGVMMRRNHFLFDRVNTIILRLMSAGINYKLVEHFTDLVWLRENPSWDPITFKGLEGPFQLLLAGYFTALTVFTLELQIFYFKKKSTNKSLDNAKKQMEKEISDDSSVMI